MAGGHEAPMVGGSGVPYGIVGGGRMAGHMARYLDLQGLAHRGWSRRSCPLRSAAEHLTDCPVILLLVSDDAIESVAAEFGGGSGQRLVHFSGRVVTPLAAGIHPLSTFGTEPYDLDTYRGVPFIVERGAVAFLDVFPALPNPHYALDPELKPLYHSLAVLAGNFTTAVWLKLFTTFERRLSLPREAAFAYLRQIAQNLEREAAGALTGPIPRGDRQTIQANLAALDGDPYREVYASFVRAMAPDLLSDAS